MWFSARSCLVAAALFYASNALPQATSADDSTSDGASAPVACNNSPSLCSRRYNEVTHLGAHNSYALRDASTDNSISGNQYLNATRALDAGLRLLQVQTHQGDTTLQLCHSSCSLLDAGPLEDWLKLINTWMNENPNEVVTLLVVNADNAVPADFQSALVQSGLSERSYVPTTAGATADWPTLQTMIDSNTRFVSFVTNLDYDATAAPAVLPEFDYVFETPFDVQELDGFNCTLDRPSGLDSATNALSQNYLSLANHFKYSSLGTLGISVPDEDNIETVNSKSISEVGALGTHLDACRQEWGGVPNFVLVDFFNAGETIVALDSINDVSDAEGRTQPEDGGSGAGLNAAGRLHSTSFGALVAFGAAVFLL
ncbi:PI-PLC X domain-containing protein [Emericellopsis cladophorae]|uniref:PI-PLC X domain-containing protein n=1 Tax=Emericellopsis cladophorae TaxID=2686198 RepID=A0A9P9Y3D4_9HYPO|nr:PI-PLC X domain-containing protein [Emericellopsis cladophorae]KAI6782189.1 PI-PLC X domain-containing protein [Emericellopsis cladophorae]